MTIVLCTLYYYKIHTNNINKNNKNQPHNLADPLRSRQCPTASGIEKEINVYILFYA